MFRKLMATAAVAALLLTAAFARAQATASAPAEDPLGKIATYEFGQSRAPLMQIEELSRQAEQKEKIEAAMIEVLGNAGATVAGKQFACRMLRLVGTEKSVPALEKLLADEKISHMARWALQAMPFPAVDAALEKALDGLTGDLRIGAITSLGARKDAGAVAKLAALAGGDDAKTARAAIASLGQIGNGEAAQALAGLKPADKDLAGAVADARLLAADSLVAAGKAADAKATYQELYGADKPELVRVAALRGIVKTDGAAALPTLVAAMKDAQNAKLSVAACKFTNEIQGAETTKALCDAMDGLAPGVQVAALTALMTRGDAAAGETAAKMLASSDDGVKIAAAKALIAIGGAGQVPALAKASAAGGPAGDAALEALGLIHGEGAGAAVRAQMTSENGAIREKAIAAIEARRDAEAIEGLVKAMGDSEAGVKTAAAKALGAVAGEKDIPTLADMLVKADGSGRGAIEKALVSVAARVSDKDAAAEQLVGKMAAADNAAKGSLMNVLAGLAGPKAYEAISGQMGSSDVELKKAAIRAFATWPDKKPAPQLLEVAKNDADPVCKVLALRGYVAIASQSPDTSNAEKVQMLQDAMAIAQKKDEKSQILSGLAKVPDPAALKQVEPLLDDAELATEAQIAYVKIAADMKDKRAATTAVEKVLAMATSDAVKKQAQAALTKLTKGSASSAAKAGKAGKGGAKAKDAAARPAKGERKAKAGADAKGAKREGRKTRKKEQ